MLSGPSSLFEGNFGVLGVEGLLGKTNKSDPS